MSVATPAAGMRIGPYELQSRIGAGGMGEVWKARDPRVDRAVAIKFSQARFSERFEREARTIASLNHPYICTLHDVGPNYLVMEFVEGEPVRGRLPLQKAAAYAGQILDALDAAHKKGIIHRDLKPANILLTRQGIKLLDFGLAKQESPLQVTDTTLTAALTQQGQILGTLQYMAPEQLQGLEADARSDLFAFGCVLYEMLTGKRAFDGASAASVIAAILEREPAALDLPPSLERVVRKCLAKDPEERFQTARDLKTNLAWALEQPSTQAPPKRLWAAAAAVVAVALLAGWAIGRRSVHEVQPEPPTIRYTITPPENTTFRGGKVSPDGRWVALFGSDTAGKRQLWVHKLDSLAFQPLASATESDLFWSPDSRFIAFEQDGKLKKIEPSGGAPQTICDAGIVVGGSWNRNGTIIFGNGDSIDQVPEKGGETKPGTHLDPARSETLSGFPFFLPDGRHFLYTIHSQKQENGGIYIGSIDSPDARVRLLSDLSNAEYTPATPGDAASGYLLFARGDALMAQRFAADSLQLKGDAFPVVDKISRSASNLSAPFSVSQNGVLFINSAPIYNGDQVTWFDRAGHRLGTIGAPALHFYAQLSPDGKTLAVDQSDPQTFLPDIWLLPVGKGTAARFTFDSAIRPLWSPDGTRIIYESKATAFYAKTAGGTENQVLLLEAAKLSDDERLPCDWSRDGRFLIYSEKDPTSGFDLWVLPLSGNAKPISFLKTEFNETCGALSPDSRWMAYASDESGRSEIYVRAFTPETAGSTRKWQISYHGGTWPKWRRDGQELFYLDGDRKMAAVSVQTGATFQQGTPEPLFATGIYTPDARFDVTADGKRFLIPTAGFDEKAAPPMVVVNWMKGAGQ